MMKYGKKMILVDYDSGLENNTQQKQQSNDLVISHEKYKPSSSNLLLTFLDDEMTRVLNSKNISDLDKARLYVQVMNKYLFFKKDQNDNSEISQIKKSLSSIEQFYKKDENCKEGECKTNEVIIKPKDEAGFSEYNQEKQNITLGATPVDTSTIQTKSKSMKKKKTLNKSSPIESRLRSYKKKKIFDKPAKTPSEMLDRWQVHID